MTIWALLQAEVTIYVVAQTIPLLRVLFLGNSSRDSKSRGSVTGRTSPNTDRSERGKYPAAAGTDASQGVRQSIELVQLPTGKIVSADSEEGQAHKAAPATETTVRAMPPASEIATPQPVAVEQGGAGVMMDDEIHRIWADMGLSRRAWSKSPPPRTEDMRHQSLNDPGRI